MIKVKISYPLWWDEDWNGPMLLFETPGLSGIWNNVKFFIHEDIKECDFWFIYDDIDKYLLDKVKCPKENIIFITGEVSRYWQYARPFLKQFEGIFTARKDIDHPKTFKEQHICTWHIKKDYNYLKGLAPFDKKKNLSAIVSNTTLQEGHALRFDFMKYLKSKIGDEIDWFGRGVNPLTDKWEGLKDYKYSIAIENSSHEGYFTEKILDCFLSYTMPIYYGCPNIKDYFPEKSMVLIDLNDFDKSLKTVKNAIENNFYEKNFSEIVKARNKILNDIGIIPYLSKWVNEHFDPSLKKTKCIIWERKHFIRKHTVKQLLYIFKTVLFLRLNGYK